MINYVRGNSIPNATDYLLYQIDDNNNYIPVAKQSVKELSFVNAGRLGSDGKPLEVETVVGAISGSYFLEGVNALTNIQGNVKRHYIRITAVCDLNYTDYFETVNLTAVLYCDTSYGDLTLYPAVLEGNQIIFKSDWGDVTAYTLSSITNLADVNVHSYKIYHAGIVTSSGLQQIGHYTDFIPVKALANDADGYCVYDFDGDDAQDLILFSYADTAFNTRIDCCNRNELSGAYKLSSQSVHQRISANSNYVIFQSKSGNTDKVHVTDEVCFSINDIALPEIPVNEGYYDEGELDDGEADFWCTNSIPLETLANGPDGWCVWFEDSGDYPGYDKLSFTDSQGNWCGSVKYGTHTAGVSAEDIIRCVKNACPDAISVVVNLNVQEFAVGKDIIYVTGRCTEIDTQFAVKSKNDYKQSHFSNVVTYTGNTHKHTIKEVVTSPTCLSTGLEKNKCSSCLQVLSTKTLEKLPHLWDVKEPAWEGKSDTLGGDNLYSCTARRVCSGNNTQSHEEVLDAEIEYNVTKEPTTTESGKQTITAYFSEDWAETQIRTDVHMFPRCYPPVGCTVSKLQTEENQYEIIIGNKNMSEIGHECVVKFTDADDVVVFVQDFVARHSSSSESYTMSTFIVELGSSVVPVKYTMYFRGNYQQSNSTIISGIIS